MTLDIKHVPDNYIFSTLHTNSLDNKFDNFSCLFIRKYEVWHVMQIVSSGNHLHELSFGTEL